jgi:hypothetical protein
MLEQEVEAIAFLTREVAATARAGVQGMLKKFFTIYI